MENLETALASEGTRTKLKRELRAEAVTRLEEAARTEADFENVVACWDKLDANRERKERYHEPIRGDMTLENGLKYNGRIFPEWMCSANYTSVRQGRYLDVIFNCPLELNEMTGHPVLCKTFQELDAEYKSLLYFMVVRAWTPQTNACPASCWGSCRCGTGSKPFRFCLPGFRSVPQPAGWSQTA